MFVAIINESRLAAPWLAWGVLAIREYDCVIGITQVRLPCESNQVTYVVGDRTNI